MFVLYFPRPPFISESSRTTPCPGFVHFSYFYWDIILFFFVLRPLFNGSVSRRSLRVKLGPGTRGLLMRDYTDCVPFLSPNQKCQSTERVGRIYIQTKRSREPHNHRSVNVSHCGLFKYPAYLSPNCCSVRQNCISSWELATLSFSRPCHLSAV